MKQFLGADFMLNSKTAVALYENYASKTPIFDFHCHLNPREIAEDKKFVDLSDAWLSDDHYKWRLMREAGIDERFVSGSAAPYEKFLKYAQIMPSLIGNPVYVWTHLELRRFFGIDKALSSETAGEIWAEANGKLKEKSAKTLIKEMNVKAVFTTDDPADDLGYHRAIARDADFGVRVSPTFRPDKAVNIDAHGFLPWLKRLEAVSGGGIKTLSGFTAALEERIRFFKLNGCVCADHDLGGVPDGAGEEETAAKTFLNVLNGGSVTRAEAENYRVYMLRFFGGEYLKNGFVQQYHIGALRNVSSRAFSALGADAGFDAVGDARFAAPLSRLLDGLDRAGRLPKTILYCLNPSDNAVLCALKNCFQDGATAGKIQFGAAWWFNDHAGGICRQLDDCMQSGSLGKFVGMLTDSRSFLSYPRHEYFRRILCDKIGAIIESGEYPPDLQAAGKIISDVCFYNAVDYFGVAETGKLSVPE